MAERLDARLDTALPGNRKTKKLIRKVGYEGAWGLICLWLYARRHHSDGRLTRLSDEDIEIAVDWGGEPGAFVAALLEAGFLDRDATGYVLHDWADHQPWSMGAEERTARARLAGLCSQHGPERGKALFAEQEERAGRQQRAQQPASDAPTPTRLLANLEPSPASESITSATPVAASGAFAVPVPLSASAPDTVKLGSPASPAVARLNGPVTEVFSYWQDVMNHPQAKLDGKRDKAVRARLKDGYTVADLKAAVEGCKRSPHHMGENDRATVYDDLELICRDGAHVDKFIKLARQPSMTGVSAAARRTIAAGHEWLEQQGGADAQH